MSPGIARVHVAALVGLCPLMALAPDAARALALTSALASMTLLTLPWWALQHRTPSAARWPTTLFVLASAAGATQLLLDSYSHGLHALMALGVPLLAANLALWSPPTMNSDRDTNTVGGAVATLRRAVVAGVALLLLGVLREMFAAGTLFATAAEYFGSEFPVPPLRWSATQHGLLLFAQPAGALFALACLMAAWQAWRVRTSSKTHHT